MIDRGASLPCRITLEYKFTTCGLSHDRPPQMSFPPPSSSERPSPPPPSSDSSYETVGIFWDYGQFLPTLSDLSKSELLAENCPPSTNASGYTLVDNIRILASQFGAVNVFKAYLQLPDKSSPRQSSLRSELQSCGLSLTGPSIEPSSVLLTHFSSISTRLPP